VTCQCSTLTTQSCLIAEKLARSKAKHCLICTVALAANLYFPIDHDVIMTA